jgi:hypothetical protein
LFGHRELQGRKVTRQNRNGDPFYSKFHAVFACNLKACVRKRHVVPV